MRSCLLLLLFIILAHVLTAQNSRADSLQLFESQMNIPADSLHAQLERTKDDTSRVGILGYMCFYYAFINPQRGIQYGQEGLALAETLKYERGIAYCNQSMSFCLMVLGNFNDALRFVHRSLQQYEKLKDYRRIAYSYLSSANIYREIGDYEKGVREARKAIRIHDSIGLSQKVAYAVIGSLYERMDRLDSALHFLQKAYELDVMHNNGRWGWLVYGLGNINSKMKNYEVALGYYRLALPLVIKENAQKDIVDVYNAFCKVYKETGKTDSSIFYASEIIQKWSSTGYNVGILQAVNTLAEVYKSRNQRDSVIKYLEMSASLNKALFTQEKEREFQNLAFTEQLRRQEMEQAELKAKEERKHILQLLGIAAFIFTFMVVVILLSRRKSLVRTARFFGLLGVLLVFEFISLLTHPWIEKVTNHNPIMMLIILVVLASILVPAHHYLEHLIKQKLVTRRRRKRPKISQAIPSDKAGL